MASIFEDKERRVIPNWRDLKRTVQLGELDIKTKLTPLQFDRGFIQTYINDFNNNRSIGHAADLINAAVSIGEYSNPDVLVAANFIIENKDYASLPLLNIVNKFFQSNLSVETNSFLEVRSLDDFKLVLDKKTLYNRIKWFKGRLANEPYNSIAWVELSRLYSIIGQRDKSEKCMKNALAISPENRFVLRSATRLFTHNEKIDFAHNLLKKSPRTKHDTWLISAEIALSTIRKKESRLVKQGLLLLDSNSINDFDKTELASSIGTLELFNANRKKGRQLFKVALKAPNDNSLAQVEWASKIDNLIDLNLNQYNVKNPFEALAYDYFNQGLWEKSLENCINWFLDMPFSKRPILFGSHITTSILFDQNRAVEFCNAGLIANPHEPELLNNLAYSLALLGKFEEAAKVMDKYKIIGIHNLSNNSKIAFIATSGLILFRSGDSANGKAYYHKAIEMSDSIGNSYISALAKLNLLREEFLIDDIDAESNYNKIYTETKDEKSIDIISLKKVIDEIRNKKILK